MTQLITPPAELEAGVHPVLAWAKTLAITSPEDYEAAAERVADAKTLAKRIADYWGPLKKSASDQHKELCNREKEMLQPLQQAETLAKGAMVRWHQEQERKRLEEQRRLQAEADKAAEAERKRLEKAAERLKTPELKEQRLAQAASVVAPVVAVPTVQPKVNGVTTRREWKHVVEDANLVPREFLVVDEKALARYAKAMGERARVPGVRFYQEESVAIGARRPALQEVEVPLD